MHLLWLLVMAAAASAQQCNVRWTKGYKEADCSNLGLSRIPDDLGDKNIKVLKMDGNPLVTLESDAFVKAGLLDVQRLSLRGCRLSLVRTDAFRRLANLRNLDLSHNSLTMINPGMFNDNNNLQHVDLSNNPIAQLGAYQFQGLTNLKDLDLSNCLIDSVDRLAFKNLDNQGTPVLDTIRLNNNRLRTIEPAVFLPLPALKELQTHGNPWNCNCDLKSFRDWLTQQELSNKVTRCDLPLSAKNKPWDESLSKLNCKPSVQTGSTVIHALPGQDVNFTCMVLGSPVPHVSWVRPSGLRIHQYVGGPTSQGNFRISGPTGTGYSRWFNLTILSASAEDVGPYTCVAENREGLSEAPVHLTFDPADVPGPPILSRAVIVYVVIAASVLLLIVVIVIVVYCICRRKKDEKKGYPADGSQQHHTNGQLMAAGGDRLDNGHYRNGGGLAYIGLIPTNTFDDCGNESAHPLLERHLPHLPHILPPPPPEDTYMMRDYRETSVTPSNFTTPRPQTSSSGGSDVQGYHSASTMEKGGSPQPDLLMMNHKAKTSTPSAAYQFAGLHHQRSSAAPSPVPSTISSVLTNQSFQRMVPYQHPLNFTTNCQTLGRVVPMAAPSPGAASLHGVVGLPSASAFHTLGRPGSSASHHMARPGYVTLPRRPKASLQPPPKPALYDGVGPRTSADGSSSLNLTKTLPLKKASAPPVMNPSHQGLGLPTLATQESISEERDEVAPLPPPFKATLSSPNILNGHDCHVDEDDDLTLVTDNDNELEAEESEVGSEVTMLEDLSGYCEPFLPALPPTPPPPPVVAVASTLPRKPSLQKNGRTPSSIPAPKRKQAHGPGQARKQFQDECADGSEV